MAMPNLTPKQAKLVKGIAEGKTKQQAAVDAGYGTNPQSASAIATETLKNPSVKQALEQALYKQGITVDLVMAPVAEALTHDDLDMRLKGHDRAMKVLAPQKDGTSVNINFNQHVTEKREEYGI